MHEFDLGAGGNVGHFANGGDCFAETAEAIDETELLGLAAGVDTALGELANFILGHLAARGDAIQEDLIEVEDVLLDKLAILRLHVAMTAAEERAIAAFYLGEIDVHAVDHRGLVGKDREDADGAGECGRLGKDEATGA